MTHPLDSASVAQFLADTPDFFEEHATLLGRVQLASPLTGRTVSLQERQMEVMREKFRTLELRLAELLRLGQENDAIAEKLQAWTRMLLLARNDVDLPHVLVSGMQTIFAVPQATLRLWRVAGDYSHTWYAQSVSDDVKLFTNGLHLPYCGRNNDFESSGWLDEAGSIRSTAILPLRTAPGADAFGLLVLGSPDAARFTDEMGTDFLSNIGATASAALSCLLD